ncbi:uncharacterized protein LOC135972183, partial [Chrysemys picta bellii]|uniref:uncharacterized protein LOC135972183 n=1 Tax=Chrysemys picta bellii TaxID=8478 RepID=UPI0032B17397
SGRSRASGSRIALRTLPVSSSSCPRGASPTCAAGGLPVCCRGRVIAGREVLAVPLLQRPPALPCVQPESRRRLKHRQPRPRGSRAALLPGPAAHGQLQASRPPGNPQALTTAARRKGKPLQLPAQQRLVRGQSDVCNSTDLPEVEIISLLEEQLPHYKLRADTIYGYDHDDWLHTPLISPDASIDLTTEQIEETLKYFHNALKHYIDDTKKKLLIVWLIEFSKCSPYTSLTSPVVQLDEHNTDHLCL